MINYAHVMEISEVPHLGSFWAGEHNHVFGGWCAPAPQGQKLPCYLELGISLAGCFSAVQSLQSCPTLWTITHQAHLFLGFSR